MTHDTSPGWKADPAGRHEHRYWDGERWTEFVADAGVSGVDRPGATDLSRATAAAPAPQVPPSQSPAPSAPVAAPTPSAVAPTPSGSRRRPVVLGAIAAVVIAAVVFGIVRATGDSEADRVKARMASALEAGGIEPDEADCIADHVVDAMGTDDLGRVDDFLAPEVPEGLSEGFPAAFTKAQTDALAACGVDLTGSIGR